MTATVLLVEDSAGDVRLTLEAFRVADDGVRLSVVNDGTEAMDFLLRRGAHRQATRPDLILLDLNIPGMSGLEVLAGIKGDPDLRSIPTVILTTSDDDTDRLRSYELHANAYLRKPVEYDEFERLIQGTNEFWLARAKLPKLASAPATRVLLVEDNPGDARLLREMLDEQTAYRTQITYATTMADAEVALHEFGFDVVLLDLGLPDTQGIDGIRRAHMAAPRVALVVLTGLDDDVFASLALQEGVEDYLVKGQIDTRTLVRAIRYAIQRTVLEELLYVAQERAEVTLNSIGEAVISTDTFGRITFLNIVAEHMTGWTNEESNGRPMTDVFRLVDGTTGEPIPNPMEAAVERDRPVHLPLNTFLVRRDGSHLAIEDSVSPIHDRGGQARGAVIIFRDVSEAREMTIQMAHSAQHDFLTGLPNRMLLNDRINQAIAAAPRHTKQLAVLFLDLDGFKHINDSLGHPIGDELLRSVAQRLVACVRVSDTVSRQGGDEFVVLLSEAEQWEDAAIVARRMLDAVAEAHVVGQHQLHVTTSIGVSVFPDDGADAETLIKNADTAMYQAKENGRQNVQFFKPAMNVRAVERQSVEEDLRLALARDEFVLHYQPKIHLPSGTISGAEALVRWVHPIRGLVPPDQFIPIAEETGLIRPLGRWVLREASRQVMSWAGDGLAVATMAVNVSAMELRDEHFLDGLFQILRETGLPPTALELELTESVLMKHAEAVARLLHTVRERGIQVALDDFGTGYSSLSYLRDFPIDALKIDRSFVQEISAADSDTSIVTAVISMARSLGLRVVAEGVETSEQLAFLRSQDCDEAQGFLFSRPVPAEAFATLLRDGIPSLAISA